MAGSKERKSPKTAWLVLNGNKLSPSDRHSSGLCLFFLLFAKKHNWEHVYRRLVILCYRKKELANVSFQRSGKKLSSKTTYCFRFCSYYNIVWLWAESNKQVTCMSVTNWHSDFSSSCLSFHWEAVKKYFELSFSLGNNAWTCTPNSVCRRAF